MVASWWEEELVQEDEQDLQSSLVACTCQGMWKVEQEFNDQGYGVQVIKIVANRSVTMVIRVTKVPLGWHFEDH